MMLLHGTGGNEADLMPLARRIAPRATLLGVRGRSTEEGSVRWFRRSDARTFDQQDIRNEAEAFAAFVEGATGGYGLDVGRLSFLGYSNGANLLAAAMRLHPESVRRAILLRGVEVLEDPPSPDLTAVRVLLLSGEADPFGGEAAARLELALIACGATVDAHTIEAGHALTHLDEQIAGDWLASG